MINLLPPEYKKELSEEEKLRMILLLGVVFFAVLISFSLILLSIRIYILGELDSEKILLSQKELETLPIREMEKEIEIQNKKLLQLNYFYEKNFKITDFLEKIFQALPPKTYLTSLDLSIATEKESKFILVYLRGFSPDRATLLALRENLENLNIFEEINFPASNWLKSRDIDFIINLRYQIK